MDDEIAGIQADISGFKRRKKIGTLLFAVENKILLYSRLDL